MATLSENVSNVTITLNGDLDDILILLERFRNIENPIKFQPNEEVSDKALSNVLEHFIRDTNLADEPKEILTGLSSGVYSTEDVRGVLGLLASNSNLLTKATKTGLDSSDVVTIATQLLAAKTNPLLAALVPVIVAQIEKRKDKKKVNNEPEDAGLGVHVGTPKALPAFSLNRIRSKYFGTKTTSPQNQIYDAPVNINVTSNNIKDVRWSEPSGWKKGTHGFFAIPLNAVREYYGVNEVHASHGRTTRLDRAAKHVVIVWTNFEGRDSKVYGRSEPVELK